MAESNPLIGRVLGRYRILEEVGRGGMAVVYRGRDEVLGREVAVKVLHVHLAGDEESRSRLQREAQAVAKLRHDNILEIYDYSGPDQADSFIVTEFIRGQTLTAFLSCHRFRIPELAELVVAEVAGALEHAHSFGVIHRDVKPENVMIRDDGRVKLTDFGIAQMVDKERLTATGQLIGSPAYLAPELVEGGRVDFRTDVFAVGIVLYRLVTGQLPFAGRNPHEVMKKIVDGRFAPPEQLNPLVGTRLSRIISRTLARDPAGRFQDMKSLRAELLSDAAAAGLEEVRHEIAEFFADADRWETEARPRMVKALVASARRQAGQGRTAATLALAGRALLLDPKDGAARELLAGIGRRRRLTLGAALVAGTVTIVMGGASLVARHHMTRHHATPASLETRGGAGGAPSTHAAAPSDRNAHALPASRAAAPSAAAAPEKAPPVALAEPARSPRAEPRPRPPARSASPADPRPSADRSIMVNLLNLKTARYSVDGKPAGEWIPGQPIVVPAGAHVVEFTNPNCLSRRIAVTAETQDLGDVRLAWAPARLLVTTTPPSTALRVTAGRVSHPAASGTEMQLSVSKESPDGRLHATIYATTEGYSSRSEEVDLIAGVLTRKTIVLQPAR